MTDFSMKAELSKWERWKAELAEAERLGRVYYLFIDGHLRYGYGADKGRTIIAESDEIALKEAFQTAWFKCRYDIDHVPDVDIMNGDVDSYPQYVTHAFRLLHQGRLVYEYTPPTPREIELGDVQLVCW